MRNTPPLITAGRFAAVAILIAAAIIASPPAENTAAGQAGVPAAKIDSLRALPKIDSHAHLMGFPEGGEKLFLAMLARHNLKWLDICTFELGGQDDLAEQLRLARRFHTRYPERVSWAVSFPLDGWGGEHWLDSTLARIEDGFEQGAVAVKVWKDLGMVLRDPDSSFVMVDDRRLDPVFELVGKRGKTLVAHIGEPRNCWLPLESMTIEGDREYYRQFPRYYGLQLPGVPGYWAQIDARDRLLARRPGLRVVGCHLGSLEYNVDELTVRFERYPNFAVDLAGWIAHLAVQNREKVIRFIMRFQDRLLYGTDNLIDDRGASLVEQLARFERVYDLDYRYLATGEEVVVDEVRKGYTCRGLDLPLEVLKKIFHDNAVRWYPGC
ncbi:MAG: amidohydrolase family protein [Candidatus Glassbacteria bacterium]